MKVQLYAAAVLDRLLWRVTFHIDIDCAYWFEQYGGKASLQLLEPVLSLSEAIPLLESLQGYPQGNLTPDSLSKAFAAAGLTTCMPRLRTITYEDYAARRDRQPFLRMDELQRLESVVAGRSLSKEELQQLLQYFGLEDAGKAWPSYVQAAYLRGKVQLQQAIERSQKRRFPWSKPQPGHRCRRCGSSSADRLHRATCSDCAGECVYCESCLTMGRLQSCSLLVIGTATGEEKPSSLPQLVEPMTFIEKWGLSPAQQEAAMNGLRYLLSLREKQSAKLHKPGQFLIWAVTGAGKTEMIFPFIDCVLHEPKKVLIATPRRDVVLELAPRLKRAFPERKIVTLYGGSEERWEPGEITLSTTHQLLRFHRSFDLVIIDEIDAFPYHNNPMLQYAAERVCKPTGAYILLSATPPAALVKAANRKALAHVKVPVRYHRHPLPVPRTIRMKPLEKWGSALPAAVAAQLKRSVNRGAQLFVFIPRIRDVDRVVQAVRACFADCCVEGTSSQDPLRAEKVTRFRQGDIRILVTTTILERGVTVPKTDVMIIQADSGTFDSASLIQMAGRAGRSKDDPHGNVVFAAVAHTNEQARAIAQIRLMNRLAKRKGYLIKR